MPKITALYVLMALGIVSCMRTCAHSLKFDEAENLIGQCDGDSNCSECYQALVKSLLQSDKNLFNLSKAFFPTNSDDRPQFVTITYRYKDTNETKVWYWSQRGSFFVYPLQTFEYLSLFFGKASTFFAGKVTTTLDQECLHADEDWMQHLTQRIKLYVAKKSITPEIDDYYIASAHNDKTWMDELNVHRHQIIIVVYSTPIIAAVIFTTFVAIFVGTTWCSCKHSLGNATEADPFISKRMKSALAALAIISFVYIMFAFSVTCYACVAIRDQPEPILENSPLAHISIMVAATDGVLLLLCIATDILALFVAVRKQNSFDSAYIVLSCTALYACLSVLLHCPYIILAYINDAELTGSMFVFYTVSWGLMFLAISRFYKVYQDLVLPCHARIFNVFRCPQQGDTEHAHLLDQGRPAGYGKVFCKSIVFIFYSLTFSILIMGSVTLLTCYLVVLPITNGLSHLFGRLIDTYHTAIVIVGAFVAYKTFIKKSNTQAIQHAPPT